MMAYIPNDFLSCVKTQEIPETISQFLQYIIGHKKPIGVIYYGSALWKKDLTGVLDFYIVCEKLSDWHGYSVATLMNYALPPNVEYYESKGLRAKVAVISLKQLRKATSIRTFDTTIWARFCQPVKIIWSRDLDSQSKVFRCVCRAVGTASWWAAYLGPSRGYPVQYWENLFRYTYAAELRVESTNRPSLILQNREAYFNKILLFCWGFLGLQIEQENNGMAILHIDHESKKQAVKKWKHRAFFGRPLNILRLVKAAFTFKGGAAYLAWKIKRHSGIDLQLTSFQERNPLLNAPWVLYKLYRQGVFKR